MIRTRLGLLGLCAVVLGVMAFSASAAQAEENAVWLILTLNEKKEVTGLKTAAELPAIVEGSLENNDGSLLSKIVGIKVKFLCTNATLVGVKLEGKGKLTEGGRVKFTGCKTFLNEVEAPECETHSAGEPVGSILSNEGKGLLVLHTFAIDEPKPGEKIELKEGVTRIEPKTGETFVTLTLGAACPIGNNVPIIGKLYVKDCEGKLTTHLVIHLIEELKALTTLWTISKTTEHIATVDGSTLVSLTGAHASLAWGGMPSSQAETAKWLILAFAEKVETVTKTGEELPTELKGSIESNDASLLSTIAGIKFKLLCTAASLIGIKLESEGKLTTGGRVKFTGCAIYLNEILAPECEPRTGGSPVGTIETNPLKGETVLHEPSAGIKEGVTKVEPETGTILVTVQLGAACLFGQNLPVIGKLYLKDCEGKFTTHLVQHLAEELPALTNLWVINETGEHKATLDGSALVSLAGAHTGLAWGGMPG